MARGCNHLVIPPNAAAKTCASDDEESQLNCGDYESKDASHHSAGELTDMVISRA